MSSIPTAILRDAGLLEVTDEDDGEHLGFGGQSRLGAWSDHQMSHVFVRDTRPGDDQHGSPTCSVMQPASPKSWRATTRPLHVGARRAAGDVVLISDAEQLAGLLLVAGRRHGAELSPARSTFIASRATIR